MAVLILILGFCAFGYFMYRRGRKDLAKKLIAEIVGASADMSESDKFMSAYSEEIEEFEEQIYDLNIKARKEKDIDAEIVAIDELLAIWDKFKDFCSSHGPGGTNYFSDMWEHCHNISNPDFRFIDPQLERKKYLQDNYEAEKAKRERRAYVEVQTPIILGRLRDKIQSQPGIMQSDVAKMFGDEFENIVRNDISSMAKSGELERVKDGRSYRLYLKGQKA